jgi:3-hydroxybutyryl-CoA dehydratase
MRRFFGLVIKKGTSWSVEKQFMKKDVVTFSELSGDKNPVHLSEEAASKTSFKKPIAHGMLGASLFSNILGNNIEGAIYLKQSLKFVKPVFYDEKVKAVVTVTETIAEKKRVTLDTKLYKQDGTVAIEGEALIWVTSPEVKVE